MANFRFLRAFADPALARFAGARARIRPIHAERLRGEGLAEQFARALAAERAIDIKELCEAGEVFVRARKYVTRPVMADLCAGCGVLGVLFALFERKVEQVHLLDKDPPPSLERVIAAAIRVGPWVESKIVVHRALLAEAGALLPDEAALVGVHACGDRTDQVLDLALARRAPVAVLPCCHAARTNPAPGVLRRELGEALSCDIDRTYRMERAGYRVRWKEIPAQITPLNRLLVATPRADPAAALELR